MTFESINEIKTCIIALKQDFKRKFTIEEASDIGNQMGLWKSGKYDLKEFWMGLNVELEHGTSGNWNVTNNDPIMTAKIALAHMDELPDYYKRLEKMEEDGEKAKK
jgi:hypothetical protein